MASAKFWRPSDFFTSPGRVTDARVLVAEERLGYRLPAAYTRLLRSRNGGEPVNACFPTASPTTWAADHVAITAIKGLGGDWGIDSERFGTRHAVESGYPPIGVAVGECPSAGHDMIMLDYRRCGPQGEPEVVHVDTGEGDGAPRITFLAVDFAAFLEGLVHERVYDTSVQDKVDALAKVATGHFSPLLAELCVAFTEVPGIDRWLRRTCRDVVMDKGYFALHGDPRSLRLYDVQFLLYTTARGPISKADYLRVYPEILTRGAEFSTGGYAPGFVEDWLVGRTNDRRIVAGPRGLQLAPAARALLVRELLGEV